MADAYEKDADFKATLESKLVGSIDDTFVNSTDFEVFVNWARHVAGGSADAADKIAFSLKRYALPELAREAPTGSDTQTAIKDIRESQIDDWSGPAADAFRTYLNTLEQCLKNQYDFLLALRGLVECKRNLHYAKREAIIDICNQVVGGSLAHTWRDKLADAAKAVLSAGASLAGGSGPVGAVADVVLETFGKEISKGLSESEYHVPGWDADLEKGTHALKDLQNKVIEEQASINRGLAELMDLSQSFTDRLVPPMVGGVG